MHLSERAVSISHDLQNTEQRFQTLLMFTKLLRYTSTIFLLLRVRWPVGRSRAPDAVYLAVTVERPRSGFNVFSNSWFMGVSQHSTVTESGHRLTMSFNVLNNIIFSQAPDLWSLDADARWSTSLLGLHHLGTRRLICIDNNHHSRSRLLIMI